MSFRLDTQEGLLIPITKSSQLTDKVDSRPQIHVQESVTRHAHKSTGPTTLPVFSSLLFATVLEDTLKQLSYIDQINNEICITKTLVDYDRLLRKKYGIKESTTEKDLQLINPKNVHKEEYKFVKLSDDRALVYNTLLLLFKELSLTWTFRTLLTCLHDIQKRHKVYEDLQLDEIKNKALRKDLMKQIRQQRNYIKTIFYDTENTIEQLKTQVQDAVLHSETEARYAMNWQRARTEQHLESIRIKEEVPCDGAFRYRAKLEDEQRVHSEIEMLANIKMSEKLEEVELWMNKYEEGIEKMDLKIQVRQNQRAKATTKREDLEETVQNHASSIEAWVKFKNERERIRLFNLKMNRAAVAVQAWWRGLLVRKELGPFKPKKKQKKRKK